MLIKPVSSFCAVRPTKSQLSKVSDLAVQDSFVSSVILCTGEVRVHLGWRGVFSVSRRGRVQHLHWGSL